VLRSCKVIPSYFTYNTSVERSTDSAHEPQLLPTRSTLVDLALPVRNVVIDHLGSRIDSEVPPNGLHKVSLGIHEVEVDAVIYKVILTRFHIRWRGEVHSVGLAHVLDFLPSPCHPEHVRMKFGEVPTYHLRRISCWVATDEDWQHHVAMHGLDPINHARHLIQLLGADIWAVREPEIYQTVFAFEILLCEFLAVVIREVERPANKRLTNALVGLCNTGSCHASLLVAEIDGETGAGQKKKKTCLP